MIFMAFLGYAMNSVVAQSAPCCTTRTTDCLECFSSQRFVCSPGINNKFYCYLNECGPDGRISCLSYQDETCNTSIRDFPLCHIGKVYEMTNVEPSSSPKPTSDPRPSSEPSVSSKPTSEPRPSSEPSECCLENTVTCMACQQKVTEEELCRRIPTITGCRDVEPSPSSKPRECCAAIIASCEACRQRITENEFCRRNPRFEGCSSTEPSQPPSPSKKPINPTDMVARLINDRLAFQKYLNKYVETEMENNMVMIKFYSYFEMNVFHRIFSRITVNDIPFMKYHIRESSEALHLIMDDVPEGDIKLHFNNGMFMDIIVDRDITFTVETPTREVYERDMINFHITTNLERFNYRVYSKLENSRFNVIYEGRHPDFNIRLPVGMNTIYVMYHSEFNRGQSDMININVLRTPITTQEIENVRTSTNPKEIINDIPVLVSNRQSTLNARKDILKRTQQGIIDMTPEERLEMVRMIEEGEEELMDIGHSIVRDIVMNDRIEMIESFETFSKSVEIIAKTEDKRMVIDLAKKMKNSTDIIIERDDYKLFKKQLDLTKVNMVDNVVIKPIINMTDDNIIVFNYETVDRMVSEIKMENHRIENLQEPIEINYNVTKMIGDLEDYIVVCYYNNTITNTWERIEMKPNSTTCLTRHLSTFSIVVEPTDNTAGTPTDNTAGTPTDNTAGTPTDNTAGTPTDNTAGTPNTQTSDDTSTGNNPKVIIYASIGGGVAVAFAVGIVAYYIIINKKPKKQVPPYNRVDHMNPIFDRN